MGPLLIVRIEPPPKLLPLLDLFSHHKVSFSLVRMEYSSHLHLTPLAINYSVSSCLFYSWSVDAPLLRSGVRENARGAACVARLHRDGKADARRADCCRWHSTDLRRGNVNELRTARYLGVHERTEVFVSQGRETTCVYICACVRGREREGWQER